MSEELFEAYLDGRLDKVQTAELTRLLREDPLASREFATCMRDRALLGLAARQLTAVGAPVAVTRHRPARVIAFAAASLAGVAAMLMVGIAISRRDPPQLQEPSRANPIALADDDRRDMTITLRADATLRYQMDLHSKRIVRISVR